jgi:hypothetical protein
MLPDDIKKHGRRHSLLDKYDKQVPFINDEPEPGSHTQLTAAQKQVLYDRENVSTGMTVAGNEVTSSRKPTHRIPRKQR